MYTKEPISAIIHITYDLKPEYLIQRIRTVVTQQSHLKYFKNDKYRMAREVATWMESIYVGNGENVSFSQKKEFKNITTVYYTYEPGAVFDLNPVTKRFDGFKPRHDGCLACEHLLPTAQGQDRCAYYQIFLEKHKLACLDFVEKP